MSEPLQYACNEHDYQGFVRCPQCPQPSSFVPAPGSVIDDAIRERDAYFTEAARTKETLAEIIPALEIASKCRADDLRATCPGNSLTPDEWAALWMARAILEADSPNESSSPAADLLEEKKTQEAKRDALAQGDKWYHWHDGVAHGLHVAVEHLRMTHPVPND